LDDIEKIADGAAGTNVVPGSLLVLAMLSTVTVLVAFAVTRSSTSRPRPSPSS
jgi:hypothetical protein